MVYSQKSLNRSSENEILISELNDIIKMLDSDKIKQSTALSHKNPTVNPNLSSKLNKSTKESSTPFDDLDALVDSMVSQQIPRISKALRQSIINEIRQDMDLSVNK